MKKIVSLIILSTFIIVSALGLHTTSANQDVIPNKIILTPENTLNFRGPIDMGSILAAELELVRLSVLRGDKDYPIYLVFDSPGGSIYAGEAFIEFAKQYKNIHVINIFSASMAAMISQSLNGKRYVLANSITMFHRASGSFEGQFETGEIESQLNLWKSIVRNRNQIIANRIGITLEQYNEKVMSEWWIYGQSTVDQGVADELVQIECTEPLIKKEEKIRTVFAVLGIVLGESVDTYSGCPLIRSVLKTEETEQE